LELKQQHESAQRMETHVEDHETGINFEVAQHENRRALFEAENVHKLINDIELEQIAQGKSKASATDVFKHKF